MIDRGQPKFETKPPTTPVSSQPSGLRGYWYITVALSLMAIVAIWFDRTLANPDSLDDLPGDLKRFFSLSEIFAHGFGIAVVMLGIWLLSKEHRRFIPRIFLCAVWPPMAVHLVKILVGRKRPIAFFDEEKIAHFPVNMSETWLGFFPRDQFNLVYHLQSFPSGHTATAWGLAIGMACVFPKGRWLFFVIAMLASVQRVTSFAHWPSDVFAGAAIAFMMAGALTQNWGFGFYLGKFENRGSLLLANGNHIDWKKLNDPESGTPSSAISSSDIEPDVWQSAA
ncbi:MAG: phosphatase PAP2 family protein [Mariniblastus sp.]